MDVEGIEAFADELGDWIVTWPARPFDGLSEFELFCPLHENPATSKKPSCTWQPKARHLALALGVFCCHTPGCDLPSDGRKVKELWDNRDGSETVVEMSEWKSSHRSRPRHKSKAEIYDSIDDETWEVYRELLFDDPGRVGWFAKQGIQSETLAKFNWAWIQGKECYIYPVHRLDGEIEGWRLYDPFHIDANPPRDKKRWFRTREHHSNQLYGLDQFDGGASVLLSEGETDLMFLHQDGFTNSVSQTGGAGTWKAEWSEWFRDKSVYTVYDPDKAGIAGRESVEQHLKDVAEAVYHIDLPDGLDYKEWRLAGHDPSEFSLLIQDAKEAWRRAGDGLPTDGVPLDSVAQIKDATTDNILTVRAYVAGKAETPWKLPKVINMTCGLNQGRKCETCPRGHLVAGQVSPVSFRPDEDDSLLEMMDEKSDNLPKIIAKATGLHCAYIDVETTEHWLVEQISVQDPVDSSRGFTSDTRYSAFHFYDTGSHRIEPSHDYRLVARRLPDPRYQRLVVTAWNAQRTTTDLDSFALIPPVRTSLAKFRPTREGLTGLKIHLNKKYKDLAINVTKIAERHDLHLLYDLVTHSVGAFKFNNIDVVKGMLDCLVIGDTRTGKTEMARLLNDHYGVGYLISGENSSYAGLIGGSAEVTGARARMPDWGILPRHHRRFIVIDESSGMADLIAKMSSVRSSGRAEIHKQGGGEVPAMVRLLWLANPVSHNQSGKTRPISEYHGGAVDAIADLIKSQEDIARFDLAMVAASEEVPEESIQLLRNTDYPARYRSEDCHNMVMFAWTRQPHQVVFPPEVVEEVYAATRRLAGRYVAQPPLVQGANFDIKLARLCVALATMTYSVTSDGETVTVRTEHVKYVEELVRRCYDNPLFGYGKQSAARHQFAKLGEDSAEEVLRYFRGVKPPGADSLPDGRDVAAVLATFDSLFQGREFTDTLADMNGMAPLRWLVEKGMLERSGTRFKMTRIVREILEDARGE